MQREQSAVLGGLLLLASTIAAGSTAGFDASTAARRSVILFSGHPEGLWVRPLIIRGVVGRPLIIRGVVGQGTHY